MISLPLLTNLFEVFEFNQTYIEDLKDLYGRPYQRIEGLKAYLGQDWLWWALPTQPVLRINY